MWPAAGRVSSGVAGRARLSRRLARGAAGWPGRAATASRPAGHPASHAEKRAGRLEKTGWPTGRPAGQNRLADRLAGRPPARRFASRCFRQLAPDRFPEKNRSFFQE